MKRLHRPTGWLLGSAAAATLAAPSTALAGGLFAGDAGSAAQTRAGAFVARADDPTALGHNPAGLVKAGKSKQLYVGANVVHFSQTFDRDGVYQQWTNDMPAEPSFAGQEMPEVAHSGPVQPIPFIAYTHGLGNMAIGVGLIAPQGYPNRSYPETVTVGGVETAAVPSRYDMVEQESIAAFPSLGFAYRVSDKLDVGARVSWGVGMLKAKTYLWGSQNHIEDVESDGIFTGDVTDTFIPTFGLGVLFRPTDSIEIGASYQSQTTMKMKGTGTASLGARLEIGGIPTTIGPIEDEFALCETGGTHEALKACIDLILPMHATVGARYILTDGAGRERGDIELDLRWENWAAAKDVVVIVDAKVENTNRPLERTVLRHGFEDVFSVRLGGQYGFPMGANWLVVRAGAAYDTAAAPNSWTRLDIDGTERLQFAGGVSYQMAKYRFDLGGAAILSADRTVEGPDPFNPPADADQPLQKDRTQPDAQNPQSAELNQQFHPINNGTFSSGYFIIATGVTFIF